MPTPENIVAPGDDTCTSPACAACATPTTPGPLSFFSQLSRLLRAAVGGAPAAPAACPIARWCNPQFSHPCTNTDPPATILKAIDDGYSAVQGQRLEVSLDQWPIGVLRNDEIPVPPNMNPAGNIDAWNNYVRGNYRLELLSLPHMGALELNDDGLRLANDGTFTYIAHPLFTGEVSFTYKIINRNTNAASNPATATINIRLAPPPLIAPVPVGLILEAKGDGPYNIASGQLLTVPATGEKRITYNDRGLPGRRYKVALHFNFEPAHAATFQLKEDGSFKYRSEATFNNSIDQFLYKLVDHDDPTQKSNFAVVNIRVGEGILPGVPWRCVNGPVKGNWATQKYKYNTLSDLSIWPLGSTPGLPSCQQIPDNAVPPISATKMPKPWPQAPNLGAADWNKPYEFYWWTNGSHFPDKNQDGSLKSYDNKAACQNSCRDASDAEVNRWENWARDSIDRAADNGVFGAPPWKIWWRNWMMGKLNIFAPQLRWVSKSQI